MKSIIDKIKHKKTEYIQKATYCACFDVARKYKAEVGPIRVNNNNFIMVKCDKFTMLMTICKTNKYYCMKIEEVYVEKKYRNRGVLTDIIKILKESADETKCILGLWCRKEDSRLYDFYIKQGFTYIETLEDDWLEY